MAKEKDNQEGRQEPSVPAPTPTPSWQLVDIDPKSTVFVPLTNREYKMDELAESDAQQLLAKGWPHIQSV